MAISLVAVGCFSFAQEKDWIEYGEDEHWWTITVYSPDRSYWIVIQDKNLWATEVWGWVNAPRESYGNYYQRWNNYWFPSDPDAVISFSSSQVDTSEYWPENPYSSSTFIKRSGSYSETDNSSNWSSQVNDNLRWWEWDDDTNWWGLESNNPISGRRWPCPQWYHVPSIWELDELAVIWYNNKYDADVPLWYTIEELWLYIEDDNITTTFSEDLLIPFSSLRWWDDW